MTDSARPPPKRVAESAINEQPYEIFPHDLNSKNTMFGGRVMEIADKVAGLVAMRHSGRQCVTAQVDTFRFIAPAKMGEVLIFKAAINRVWCSSMEVGVKVFAINYQIGERRHVVSAYFTLVALSQTGQKECLPEVIPETEDEKRRHQEADERRKRRLQEAGKVKILSSPNATAGEGGKQ